MSPPRSHFVSIAANPIGGASYRQAAAFADVISKANPKLTVTAEETSGYMENVKLITEGEVEVAFSNNQLLAYGYRATGDFAGYRKGVAMGMMALAPNIMHIVVPENSSVRSIRDIAGKKVGLGQPGGSSLVDALFLMQVIGMPEDTFTPYKIKSAEQADMMKNGQLDVFMWNGKIPVSPVIDLSASRKVRFIELEPDVLGAISKADDTYGTYLIPAGSYKGQDKDINTFGNTTVLLANADVPEEVIYGMVKAIIEKLDELITFDASFKTIKRETLLSGITVPLHPGALKYYEEINVPGIGEFKARYQNLKP